jgi:hypothetical protein
MVSMNHTIRIFAKAQDKACSGPYVMETEALEHVMQGKTGKRWWDMVPVLAREAEAMLELASRRRRG